MNLYSEIVRRRGIDLDRPALAIRLDNGQSRSLSFRQLFDRVDDWANKLAAAGIVRGDRIAVIADGSPEWAIAFLAQSKMECTGYVVDPALTGAELALLVKESGFQGILATPDVIAKLPAHVPCFDILADCACLTQGGPLPPTPDPDPAVAVIFRSSGTTSSAKAVMQLYDGIMESARMIITHYKIVDSDSFLAVLPAFHIYGFMGNFLCPLLAGASICFIETVSSENLMKAFVGFRPVVFNGVPRIFNVFKSRILDSVKAKGPLANLAFHGLLPLCALVKTRLGINLGKLLFKEIHEVFGGRLRGCISAGAYLPPATARFFDALGIILLDVYGLTETGVPLAANTLDDYDFSTNGKALDSVRLRIHEPDENGSGEIRAKSLCMMKGYFRDPEATNAAFDADGWFMTGDIARRNRRGRLIISGRIKENIVLATGKKLSPADVEARYPSIAGVKEFVVCGLPGSVGLDDEVHGFVVRDETAGRSESEIEADYRLAGAALPAYMRVGKLHFVEEIPKTSLAKPKRYLLRQNAARQAAVAQPTAAADQADAGSDPLFDEIHHIVLILNPGCGPIQGTSRFVEDLGFDSLSLTEFFAMLQNRQGRDLAPIAKPNLTVGEVLRSLREAPDQQLAVEALNEYPAARGVAEGAIFGIISAFSRLAYRIEIKGAHHLPAHGGYILCPNHQTHLDSLWIMMHLPKEHRERFSCMAKREHLERPLGRAMLRVAGGIPVDRAGNTAPAFQRCLQRLQEGNIVLIHPEGTRTPDGSLGAFKSGAAKLSLESGLPMVPVRIEGGFSVYPKNRRLPRLLDLPRLRRFRIGLHFGPPIEPQTKSIDDLTRSLRQTIANLLD